MRIFKDLGKIILALAILYLPLAVFLIHRTVNDLNEARAHQSIRKLAETSQQLQQILQDEDQLSACAWLRAQQRAGLIAAYRLLSTEASCHYPDGFLEAQIPLSLGQIQDFEIRGLPLRLQKQQLGDSEILLAVPKPTSLSFWHFLRLDQQVRRAFLMDFVLVIYSVCVLIFLAVVIFAKSIQNRFRIQGRDPRWLKILNLGFGWLQLSDLFILRRASEVHLTHTKDLLKDQELLETSLEESILSEIRNHHHQLPYCFQGTVAKIDINGFSTVFSMGGSESAYQLTSSLEEFGCDLLKRYGGLFEKTVGDEIVAVFKGEKSEQRATAFTRDMMQAFSSQTFKVGDQIRQFTLKAAIDSSEIKFRRRPSGYGFDGEALVRTTRLLETVRDKSKNILSCPASLIPSISSLVHVPEQVQNFEFKNIPHEKGYLIDRFQTLDEVLNQTPHLMTEFRADPEIEILLERLRRSTDKNFLDQTLNHLRQIRAQSHSLQLKNAWLQGLHTFAERSRQNPADRTFLARLIKLGENLIGANQWDASCSQALLEMPLDLEDRINASVIEVLLQKGAPEALLSKEQTLTQLSGPQSYRATGNMVLARALTELDEDVIERLWQMVISKSETERNTGIFCACEVILYYRRKNPAGLETYSTYPKLVRKLKSIEARDPRLSDRLRSFVQRL